jgi:simple sugar transport system permease protein
MRAVAGLVVGILLSLGLAALAGENPVNVFTILIKSSFGSRYDLGLTLFYSTSLVFTGLSVAIAFRAGLFNIGAEGQLLVGALSATAFALSFPNCPGWLAPWAAGIAAIVAGGIWGAIPGYLRARRGSHEVVVTMMMNFIAAGITSYYALGIFKSLDSQNPESQSVPEQYLFKAYDFVAQFFLNSPANLSLVVALIVAVLLHFVFEKTKWGFELKMSGANEQAAQYSGIDPAKVKIVAMVIAGALAGMVAFNEIMGSSGKFRIGFSPEYGFVGIAVALLAGNRPLGILASAFLFGALQKGASDLDMETAHITRDFARILQAIIIFSVIAFQYKGKRNERNS